MLLGLDALFGSKALCEMCGHGLLSLAGCKNCLDGDFCICTFNPLQVHYTTDVKSEAWHRLERFGVRAWR